MVLDAEAVVEAELIAQLELAPQLLIALVRRHSRFAPDVGEMSEFHFERPLVRKRLMAAAPVWQAAQEGCRAVRDSAGPTQSDCGAEDGQG
jgi:hypothetical protein